MNNIKFYEIQRNPILIKTLLNIWEESVRATHTFLSDDEISKIKEYVPQVLKLTKEPPLTKRATRIRFCI